jgi:hypothetical protein
MGFTNEEMLVMVLALIDRREKMQSLVVDDSQDEFGFSKQLPIIESALKKLGVWGAR